MVGAAIMRKLAARRITPITAERANLDLLDQQAVRHFIQRERPSQIILAAAKVGGIYANAEYPADFIYENLQIECNLIHEAFRGGVERLIFLGSSCIYPRDADQPIVEESLLSGPLEQTNEPYAIAKIAGVKLCEGYNRQYGTDFRCLMPTNLYGPGDNFHPLNSHVLPAFIGRFHNAKLKNESSVEIWGSGTPRREFLYVDDLADAILFALDLTKSQYNAALPVGCNHLNVGYGQDITIHELAKIVKDVVSYRGEIVFDGVHPDGTPRKLMDSSRFTNLGWLPQISLSRGITQTYEWYASNLKEARNQPLETR